METRAKYLTIGLFTFAVTLSAVLFVLWFSGAESGPKRRPLTIAFEDSVAGLRKGSAVSFNGIRVGEVTRIYFDPSQPSQAYAEVAIDSDTPVRADTRASLSTSTLSGASSIALMGGRPDAPELTSAGAAGPVIRAQQSGLAAVMESARGTAAKAEALQAQLNDVVSENRDTILAIAQNAAPAIDLFNGNSPGARKATAALSDVGAKLAPVQAKLAQTSERASALWQAVDRDRLASIKENGSVLIDTLRANEDRLTETAKNFGALSSRVGDFTPRLDHTLDRAGKVMAAIDQDKIAHVSGNIDVVRGALDASRPDLEAAQRDLASISEKMDRLSDRFGQVRQMAADFIASDDAGNAFKSVGRAIESVRRTSNRLSSHVQAISTAINRLKSNSSREFKTLSTDARRAVNDMSRTGRDIQNNPSSLILGGGSSSLPTYSGP